MGPIKFIDPILKTSVLLVILGPLIGHDRSVINGKTIPQGALDGIIVLLKKSRNNVFLQPWLLGGAAMPVNRGDIYIYV